MHAVVRVSRLHATATRRVCAVLKRNTTTPTPTHAYETPNNSNSNTSNTRVYAPEDEGELLHSKEVARVTKLGAIVNAILAVSKGVTGVAIGSTGLIADSANSCGDLLMDAAVYFTVIYSRQGNTPDKPWVGNFYTCLFTFVASFFDFISHRRFCISI